MTIKDLINITNNYQLISIYVIDEDEYILTDTHAGSCGTIENLVYKYTHKSWDRIRVYSIYTEKDVLKINI